MSNNACRAASRIGDYDDIKRVFERAPKVRGNGGTLAHFVSRGDQPTGRHWIEKEGDLYRVRMHNSLLYVFHPDGKTVVYPTSWDGNPTTRAFRSAFRFLACVHEALRATDMSFWFRRLEDGRTYISIDRCDAVPVKLRIRQDGLVMRTSLNSMTLRLLARSPHESWDPHKEASRRAALRSPPSSNVAYGREL